MHSTNKFFSDAHSVKKDMTSGISEMNHICVMRLSKTSESSRQDREQISKQSSHLVCQVSDRAMQKSKGKGKTNFG